MYSQLRIGPKLRSTSIKEAYGMKLTFSSISKANIL